jgi:hypothetical protein
MICPNCGNLIEDMAEFCKYCGKATNAAARMHFRPSMAPLDGGVARDEKPEPGKVDDLEKRVDLLAAAIRGLATRKQVRKALFVHMSVSILAVLLCAVICVLAINKNKKNIAEAIQNTPETFAAVTDAAVQDESPSTPDPAQKADTQPPDTPDTVAAICFDSNLPEDVKLQEAPQMPGEIEKPDGQAVQLPGVDQVPGLRFVEWNTRRDGSGTSFQKDSAFDMDIEKDITLYAQWIVIEDN